MIAQLLAVTHSTQLKELFNENHHIAVFESDTTLCKIFDSFIEHAHDAVIITEEALHVGIVTLKDMVRILENFENLMRPVSEFMISPLLTFDASQSVAEVLEAADDRFYGKIVVKDNGNVIGIMDHNDLLSACFAKMTSLLKQEYNILNSLIGLADNGNKELLKLATTDFLTGIGNRRLFEEVFQAHQLVVGKYHPLLHVLIFDVDNFKPINDTYGHNVGDAVLKELTELVSNSIRKSDVFVRWGGEEFAVLLRYSDTESVIKIAEHLCSLIDSHRFGSVGHLTCSFGLTEIYSLESLEVVIGRADKALYRAKSDGKNCVRIESV